MKLIATIYPNKLFHSQVIMNMEVCFSGYSSDGFHVICFYFVFVYLIDGEYTFFITLLVVDYFNQCKKYDFLNLSNQSKFLSETITW